MGRTLTIRVTTITVIAVAVGVWAVSANARQGDRYRSTVTGIVPAGLPVRARIDDRDHERLRITNTGAGVIEIPGYDRSPYARITPHAAFVNTNQGASPVKWAQIEWTGSFAFHDHRSHWMGLGRPPGVRVDSTRWHRVMRWSIPITYDGRAGRINGVVDVRAARPPAPPARGALNHGLASLGVAISVVLLIVGLRRRRTSKRAVAA